MNTCSKSRKGFFDRFFQKTTKLIKLSADNFKKDTVLNYNYERNEGCLVS